MNPIHTSAPAKIILFGEHSVVYGHPAIAMPIPQRVASAYLFPAEKKITLRLPDINQSFKYKRKADKQEHPILDGIALIEQQLGEKIPPCLIELTSSIPMASGLGSGAATSAAVIRAVLQWVGLPATDKAVCDLTFEIEKQYHGTPSGIDNTVVSYGKPVYFVKKKKQNLIEPFEATLTSRLLIADTGKRSETLGVVADVRTAWKQDPDSFTQLFTECGQIAQQAYELLQIGGSVERLGRLMNLNHERLQEMDVSSADLDRLVESAVNAGAYGAKLSGGGRGGNMIALVSSETEEAVADALRRAGARSIIHTDL